MCFLHHRVRGAKNGRTAFWTLGQQPQTPQNGANCISNTNYNEKCNWNTKYISKWTKYKLHIMYYNVFQIHILITCISNTSQLCVWQGDRRHDRLGKRCVVPVTDGSMRYSSLPRLCLVHKANFLCIWKVVQLWPSDYMNVLCIFWQNNIQHSNEKNFQLHFYPGNAYFLSNISAKKYQNSSIFIEVIASEISVVFWDTV